MLVELKKPFITRRKIHLEKNDLEKHIFLVTISHNFKLTIVCFMCVNMGENVMHTIHVSIYNCYVLKSDTLIYICSSYMSISKFMKDIYFRKKEVFVLNKIFEIE
jgi:hypothetical protein